MFMNWLLLPLIDLPSFSILNDSIWSPALDTTGSLSYENNGVKKLMSWHL